MDLNGLENTLAIQLDETRNKALREREFLDIMLLCLIITHYLICVISNISIITCPFICCLMLLFFATLAH